MQSCTPFYVCNLYKDSSPLAEPHSSYKLFIASGDETFYCTLVGLEKVQNFIAVALIIQIYIRVFSIPIRSLNVCFEASKKEYVGNSAQSKCIRCSACIKNDVRVYVIFPT